MRFLAPGLLLVFAVTGMLAAQTGDKTPPVDGKEELEKKIKELRDQIEELRKKQDALRQQEKALTDKKAEKERQALLESQRKEKDRQAKEEADKKKHFAKVEIRGKLVKAADGKWYVTINELAWSLNFGDKKELAESAQKLAGQSVLITGQVVLKKTYRSFPNPGWPYPQPGWPIPQPEGPIPFPGERIPTWQPASQIPEAPPMIIVASLNPAKD